MNPAHDHPFEFGGEVYFVRRTFVLIKTIEQEFNNLITVQSQCRTGSMTYEDLAKLVSIVLKNAAPDVDRAQIESVLLEYGNLPVAEECTKLLMSLFIGSKAIEDADDEDSENPHQAVTSTGAPS